MLVDLKGQNDSSMDHIHRIKEVEREFDKLLEDHKGYWQQRSCIQWLKKGDRNTKFFHAQASHKRRNNWIMGLEDDYGNWLKDIILVERSACDYFQDLFSSTNHSSYDSMPLSVMF